jgi:ribosomal-protein-alanine N-acetyltransferase
MDLIKNEKIIETKRMFLEPLVTQHAEKLFSSLLDKRLYEFIPSEPPNSVADLETRYRHLMVRRSPDGSQIWLNWVMRNRDKENFIGLIQATLFPDQTAKIAYMVFPKFWHKGYCKEGCSRILEHLFSDYNIMKILVEIDTRNVSSIKLAESLDFKRVCLIKNADFFKGFNSDEYRYELEI